MTYHADTRAALLRRAVDFMLTRAEYVQDQDCLPGMIMSCIAQGIVKRDGIVRTVPRYIGHSYPQVAAMLDHNTGPDPAKHLWWLDGAKVYHLHPILPSPPPRQRKKKPQASEPDYEDQHF